MGGRFKGRIPPLPGDEIEARVEHRMRWRAVLDREDPPPYEAINHEAALRMRFGGRRVAGAQLEHVLEMSEWPAVTVRVLPFSNEQFIEVTQPLLYAAGAVPQLDTVQKDSPSGSHYLDAEAELQQHRALLDVAESVSLDVGQSRQLLADIVREL